MYMKVKRFKKICYAVTRRE